MLADGADVRTIQLLPGHASLTQTQRYLDLMDEQLRRAMEVSWDRKKRLRLVAEQNEKTESSYLTAMTFFRSSLPSEGIERRPAAFDTVGMTQTPYAVHTLDSAPEAAGDALRALQASVGLVPNLAATMAESPALLKGFLTLRELYAKTGFSPAEVQVLSLVAAYENECAYCMAFHTAMALKDGVSREDVDALRTGASPADSKLGALSEYARMMVRRRGAIERPTLEAFFAAGYSKRQALDVVMGMAFSLMANYAGHVTHAPLDTFLEPFAWAR